MGSRRSWLFACTGAWLAVAPALAQDAPPKPRPSDVAPPAAAAPAPPPPSAAGAPAASSKPRDAGPPPSAAGVPQPAAPPPASAASPIAPATPPTGAGPATSPASASPAPTSPATSANTQTTPPTGASPPATSPTSANTQTTPPTGASPAPTSPATSGPPATTPAPSDTAITADHANPPPSAPATSASQTPNAKTSESERPPEPFAPEPEGRFYARLGLGVEASLWAGDGTQLPQLPPLPQLFKPATLSLDLGYAFRPETALIVRGGTWLRDGTTALNFLGAGVSEYFDDMFVTGVIGIAAYRLGTLSHGELGAEGLAGQFELGQVWRLSPLFEFALGVRFELGTPLGHVHDVTITTIGVGIFVSVALH
jgi:hypothetical protein